jgi:hypothetical protein
MRRIASRSAFRSEPLRLEARASPHGRPSCDLHPAPQACAVPSSRPSDVKVRAISPTDTPRASASRMPAGRAVALPGYSRPMIRAEQYLELVEQHTYRDNRVRLVHR